MIPFIIRNDANGVNTFAIPFSDTINACVLTAGVPESLTIPAGANFVVFSATGEFYIRANGTAAVTAGDVTNGTASEFNPAARSLVGVTSLSVVAPGACTVTAAFFG
jgi:hypothetical protein